MTTPFDLGDKVAIVVGSSRGIGRASAEAIARLGAKVVVSEPQGRRLQSGGRAVFANPAGRRRSFLAISRTKTRQRRS
jgi:NAD(P)-dependent dehydrogenase (short-subunit alcohol dehydrogenase family)